MSAKNIAFKTEGHVANIIMGDPPEDQAGVARLANDLLEICTECTSDKDVHVIILSGSGDNSFSMGKALSNGALKTGLELQGFPGLAESLTGFYRPIIAAVSGDAVGQGLELVLACDIRIAAEKSRFGLPHIESGCIPMDGGTQRLSRVIGKAMAMEMILTGKKIDAGEAFRTGLVNRIVSPEKLISAASDMAQEIASKGPVSLEYAKEAVCKGVDLTLEQGLRLEADLYYLLHTTKDRTEGIRAFQEKRKARFEGR